MRSMVVEFSLREKKILHLIACNYTNGEISKKLFISVSTVKNSLSIIFSKLGANGRVQASIIAYKRGLIDI